MIQIVKFKVVGGFGTGTDRSFEVKHPLVLLTEGETENQLALISVTRLARRPDRPLFNNYI